MSDTQGAQLDPSMNVGLTGGAFINPAYSTPSQRAQLYAYANELMKPQPVKTGWQGLAEIARALVGGYEGHQADISEQASRHLDANQAAAVAGQAFSPPAAGAGGGEPVMPVTAPSSLPADTSSYAEPASSGADTSHLNPTFADRAQDLQQDAEAAGIKTKLISGYRSPEEQADLYKKYLAGGNLAAPPGKSLHNAGLAADIVAADPSQQGALVAMAREPWRGLKAGADFGDPDHFQLAGSPSASAFTGNGPAPAPAVQAIGAALASRGPAQVAQNAPNGLPVSAQAIGQFLANPNIDPGVKHQAMEVLAPKMYQSATGQVLPSFQNQPVAPPIANLGVLREQGTGTVPAVLGGTPAAPSNIVAPPSVAGAPAPQAGLPAASETAASAADKIFGPDSILGGMKTAAAATDAKAAALKGAGDVSTEQYTHDLKAAADYQRTSLPLTKAIPLLEQLGTTGTGPGTDTWNHAMSFFQSMGIPISDPNNIKAFDEVKKYLTDNVNQNGNLGTNDKLAASFAGNPSVEVSNAAAADVAKTALSMQRFKQAQILSFGSQKDASGSALGPEKYAEYAKKFAGDYDPRAFGIDMMSPAARKALDAEMPVGSDARKKFNASLKIALETGMISR